MNSPVRPGGWESWEYRGRRPGHQRTGSLQQLRNMGYRVFDSSIDNSYDLIQNNTDRYLAARRSIAKIASLTAEERSRWFESLLPDLLHNSQLFASSKWDRLNSLQERIYNVRT